MSYVYLALAIGLTVFGQVVFKWRIGMAGPLPEDINGKLRFVGMLLLQPWVISGFAAAFLASLFWILALSRLELSHAYAFVSLNFVLVFLFAAVFFQEAVTPAKVIGLSLIVVGLIVTSRG
jgi:multidrug transporter EmrE-like cation transporter